MSKEQEAGRSVFRLAMYGVRSSGKTSILTALSLPRIPHPDGLSCAWIENADAKPSSRGDQTESPDSTSDANDPYVIGRKWLNRQRGRLKNGEAPEANPNREEMRFRFDFGSETDGTRQIELTDYSGELVEATDSDLAVSLREHMKECDGLLILAEFPRTGADSTMLTEDLEKLTGAFRVLMNEREDAARQEWPVAVLFNKWDRCLAQSGDSGPEDARLLLEQFLTKSPPPPHRALLDTVANAVGKENVGYFPVSAFGKYTTKEDGTEIPVMLDGRLQSFGLEDGFVWAARRNDELAAQQLEEAAARASWFKIWQGLPLWTKYRAASQQLKRLPKDSPLYQRVKKAQRRLRRHAFGRSMLLAVLLIVIVGLFESGFDREQYRSIQVAHANPTAKDEELQEGEKWLRDYATAPFYRHFISRLLLLTPQEATELQEELARQREEARWKAVVDAKDPVSQVTLVRKYLEAFPTGNHASEARRLLVEAETEEHNRKNIEYLQEVAGRVNALKATEATSLQDIDTLMQQISNIPHPEVRSHDVAQRQDELRSLLQQKQNQVLQAAAKADFHRFETAYAALMQEHKIADAAALLDGRTERDAGYEKLLNDFRSRVCDIIEEDVQKAIGQGRWERAREYVELANNSVVSKLISNGQIRRLKQLPIKVDQAEDRHLYELIRKYKPQCRDAIETYLTRAPLKTMRQEVDRYQEYLERILHPMQLTLELQRIKWDEEFSSWRYNYYNHLRVLVNTRPVIDVPDIVSEPGVAFSKVGKGTFEASVSDHVKIDIDLETRYGWVVIGNFPVAHGAWEGSVQDLTAGKTIKVGGDKTYKYMHEVTLLVTGVPAEPELPEWRAE